MLFVLLNIYTVYSIYQRKCRFYDISYLCCLCLHYTQIYNLCQSESLVKKYRINDISFKQLEFYKLVKPNPREIGEFIAC